jgi:hypothetical protein
MDEEKKKLLTSPEMKRRIDKFMEEKLGASYEDLRVDKPNNRNFMRGLYNVLDIDEDEISLLDLDLGMPTIVETNNISKNAHLSPGDLILAEIYSDPLDGMTMEYESSFDAKIRKNGNSYIITVPKETIEKLNLDTEKIVEIGLRRYRGEK